jgi:DNA-binding MarR family transcriptional regulator
MTRQGAGKVVGQLRDRGYVSVAGSPTNGREKAVTLTGLGSQYLATLRKAVRRVERQLQTDLGESELGEESLAILFRLLGLLDDGSTVRMRTYLSGPEHDPTPPDQHR